MQTIKFTLYSRSYCHLCDDMLVQLQAFAHDFSFSVNVVDVDGDDTLLAKFDELVPVLFGTKGHAEPQQICHYFLDVPQLKAFLNA